MLFTALSVILHAVSLKPVRPGSTIFFTALSLIREHSVILTAANEGRLFAAIVKCWPEKLCDECTKRALACEGVPSTSVRRSSGRRSLPSEGLGFGLGLGLEEVFVFDSKG